jgi:hypothetical protein
MKGWRGVFTLLCAAGPLGGPPSAVEKARHPPSGFTSFFSGRRTWYAPLPY